MLELKKGATQGEIKSRYRELSKKWHPDKYRGDKVRAARKMNEVADAKIELVKRVENMLKLRHVSDELQRLRSYISSMDNDLPPRQAQS